MILAGDLGGTKSSLALFESEGAGRVSLPQDAESFRNADFASFADLIETYRRRHPGRVDAASFGAAGPVIGGRVKGTHLPWEIDKADVSHLLGTRSVFILNDLEAAAYGVPALTSEDLHPLQEGVPDPDANAGLVAAGTGLGETLLVHTDAGRIPVASEGGHADFAPRTDLEIELFRALRSRYGRVSYERILSGPGLVDLASWTHARAGGADAWKRHQTGTPADDLPAAVSGFALEKACEWCAGALDLFVSVYGAEAGNVALRGVTRAGIYLAGGIAPKILPALEAGAFLRAFREKQPHEALLARIPVWVVRNEKAAVLGAARYATLARC